MRITTEQIFLWADKQISVEGSSDIRFFTLLASLFVIVKGETWLKFAFRLFLCSLIHKCRRQDFVIQFYIMQEFFLMGASVKIFEPNW